jgi:hypothetical protein
MSPSPGELQNRLSIAAKNAADAVDLEPDRSAMDYLGTLVNRATEELKPDANSEDIAAAEEAFRRLTQEVAIELGSAETAGAGAGEEGHREAAAQPVGVTGPQIEAVLGKLCPGFFPFC